MARSQVVSAPPGYTYFAPIWDTCTAIHRIICTRACNLPAYPNGRSGRWRFHSVLAALLLTGTKIAVGLWTGSLGT